MAALRMTIPITKVDAVQRLVFGVATAEVADRTGEICDYASTKPLYEKWSKAIATTTGGRSLGNLRAMHGAVAAGKVTALKFNDAAKQIEICAKVVDEHEWEKVEEGVYTGFSQGGTYARRWTDEDGIKRYTAEPHEISLVDVPCLAEARFELIKADGSHESRPFKSQTDVIDPLPLEVASTVAKAGARNSRDDLERIQSVHDESVALGAVCGGAHGQPIAEVGKRFDVVAEHLLKSLSDLRTRLQALESEPRPLPFAAQARAVSKHEDGASSQNAALDALLADPEALSLLAIKLAQKRGAP